jgi:hypothetical protein
MARRPRPGPGAATVVATGQCVKQATGSQVPWLEPDSEPRPGPRWLTGGCLNLRVRVCHPQADSEAEAWTGSEAPTFPTPTGLLPGQPEVRVAKQPACQ